MIVVGRKCTGVAQELDGHYEDVWLPRREWRVISTFVTTLDCEEKWWKRCAAVGAWKHAFPVRYPTWRGMSGIGPSQAQRRQFKSQSLVKLLRQRKEHGSHGLFLTWAENPVAVFIWLVYITALNTRIGRYYEVGDCGWNDELSKTDSDRWSHGNEPDFDPRLVHNGEPTWLIDLSNRKLPVWWNTAWRGAETWESL